MATDPVGLALLRLLQLASPALPIGAYAYSQGLETAIERGWVKDEVDAEAWIAGLLRHTLSNVDAPIFVRLYRAWEGGGKQVIAWNDRLYAARESAELQQEDYHLGTALARLLVDLDMHEAHPWRIAPRVCLATLFSLAAVRWEIPLENAVRGYLWAWADNQVATATRLIPLGQTASQRVLSHCLREIALAAQRGLAVKDDDIGCSAAGLALASAYHETQYSRLFRS